MVLDSHQLVTREIALSSRTYGWRHISIPGLKLFLAIELAVDSAFNLAFFEPINGFTYTIGSPTTVNPSEQDATAARQVGPSCGSSPD